MTTPLFRVPGRIALATGTSAPPFPPAGTPARQHEFAPPLTGRASDKRLWLTRSESIAAAPIARFADISTRGTGGGSSLRPAITGLSKA